MKNALQILAALARHATGRPDCVALREIAAGRVMTWSDLHTAVADFAAQLTEDVPAGSVLLLRCPNSCDFHVAFLGALSAGMTIFPISHDIAPAELETLAKKASAAGLIDADLTVRALDGQASGRPALYLQSSGTSGLPKIVRRDARSLDAIASNIASAIGFAHSDRVLSCVPLSHSYGLEHGLLAPILAGSTVHLAQGFDLPAIRREIAESAITLFPAVPSIYEMLGNLPHGRMSFSSLRAAYSAGGPLPPSVFEKVRDGYGILVGQLYGATEIGSITFADPAGEHFESASVGRAMKGVEFQFDRAGQLRVRAPSMMSSYVGDESPLTADGFFPTGDLARVDAHGNLFITGRIKFLIDVGGLKVNPMEVEQAITEHPGVAACVVVPMRLSETVNRLKAIITPTDPDHPPASDELRQFARDRLTGHKVPRVFEVRDDLPRSSTGKVLRHLLVESA